MNSFALTRVMELFATGDAAARHPQQYSPDKRESPLFDGRMRGRVGVYTGCIALLPVSLNGMRSTSSPNHAELIREHLLALGLLPASSVCGWRRTLPFPTYQFSYSFSYFLDPNPGSAALFRKTETCLVNATYRAIG